MKTTKRIYRLVGMAVAALVGGGAAGLNISLIINNLGQNATAG